MKKIDVTQPYAMTSPFAEGVYSSVSTSDFEIPADTSTAPDDTCVIDDGFLPITSTDLDDGGIAPERKNFNGMFYLSTDQRFYLQNGGFITYNSNVATAIGGYPQDAVLGFIDGQGTYKLVRSLIDDNTNDFTQDETLIDGEHWEEIAMGGGGSGYQMFDIVMKDHVLSYAETLGLAPLGTYVYKEAIAGTRYGYPDFYQKLVDEYNDGTSAYMSSNINIVGSLIDNDGVLSGFSSTSWAVLPESFTPSTNNWAITVKFKTGTIGTAQNIVNSSSIAYQPFDIHIDSNGNISSGGFVSNTSTMLYLITGTTVLIANTDYYVQLEYNSSAGYTLKLSTDGVTFTTEGTSAVTTPINGGNNIALGADFAAGGVYYGEAFTGSIDLNESYINIDGTRWWTGTNTCIQNSNKHRFYDIADKATFDNIFGITGECWYYGIDTTNERIFLPRSTRFKNGTSSDVGGYQAAGLPNIEGHIRKSNTLTAEEFFGECVNCDIGGAFSGEFGSQNQVSDGASVQTALTGLNFDASRSSSIYGASNTVEYASTKLIPYMVVGNQSDWAGMTDVVNQGMTILNQVNAGLATKVDLDGSNATFPHITETYSNGTSGYNVYSNGYCEQWGEFTSSDMTVTFLKPFIDTNYNINVGYYDYSSPDDANYASVQWRNKTVSTVRFQASYGGVLYATTVDWCARGYISI